MSLINSLRNPLRDFLKEIPVREYLKEIPLTGFPYETPLRELLEEERAKVHVCVGPHELELSVKVFDGGGDREIE